MYDVISGPPPCTMTGLMPTSFMSTMSLATCSRSAGSVIAAPPYLMTTVLPDVRLMQGSASVSVSALSEQVLHVASFRLRRVHERYSPLMRT